MILREKYLNELISKMHNSMVKVVTGIRRCGKSYLLFNIFKNYLIESGISQNQIIEIILDDDEFASFRNPLKLGEYLREKTNDKTKDFFILIDEIQYCKPVENPDLKGDFITFYNVLNGVLRRENIDLYVTGSNSKMLSSDILTEFRGRGDQVHIYPLTFSEFFNCHNLDFEDAYIEYSTFGGLPKIALMNDDSQKSEYLKNLFEEVYIKDIIARNEIKNPQNLSDLLNVLSSSIGSFTNPTKLENTFKSELKSTYSVKTIQNHIEILKDSFLIYEAKRFDIKGRKYIGANSKFYFSDIGLRNARLNFRQIEQTHIMENVIYNELLARGYNVDVGIVEINSKNENGSNVKKQLEVDFVANKGNEKIYIQSAFMMFDEEKTKQEKKSLLNIDDSFKKIIVTKENCKTHYDENGFVVMSLKSFLLDF